MYTQTEKVNIEPKSYLPVFRISQNDVGRTLKAHLVSDEGTIAIPAGATVTMAGIKPSGLGYTVTGTINGSDVTFETDAVMTDEAGQIESEIRIVDGETLIGTTNVVLNIEPNPHPDDVTDGQREPLVNEITALLNQITAQADRTEEYSSKVLNMTVTAHESQEPTVTKTEGEVVNLDFGLPRGEKGERGERGEQGEAGKDGKDGLDGKDGKDGKDGINGVTPDFSIGTVTTLEPTESASVTLTGTEEEPVLNFGIPRGAKGEQGDVSLSDLEKIMVTDTASGAIASFPDGSDLLPAKSLIVNIVPQQSGSGTPSPDNVREISGWESVIVNATGKNLLSTPYNDGSKTNNGITWTVNDDGTVTANGTATGDSYFYFRYNDDYLPYSSYHVSGCPSGGSTNTYWLDVASWAGYNQVKDVGDGITFNHANLDARINNKIRIIAFIKSGTTANNLVFKPMITKGACGYDDYTPYIAPTTHTTSLGRTVYGGTLDVVRGTLTVTHAIVDLGSLNWRAITASSSRTRFRSADLEQLAKKATAMSAKVNALCSCFELVSYSTGNGGTGTGIFAIDTDADLSIWVSDSAYSDATAFKTAVSGQMLCYELSTPTTYTLTPSTINTLSGVNNVWADSGDCSIEYYADTKLYIDKKLGGN